MGRVRQFVSQILPCPMLIMLAIAPQAAFGDIVNNAFICNPDFRSILSVSEGKLLFGECWKRFHDLFLSMRGKNL